MRVKSLMVSWGFHWSTRECDRCGRRWLRFLRVCVVVRRRARSGKAAGVPLGVSNFRTSRISPTGECAIAQHAAPITSRFCAPRDSPEDARHTVGVACRARAAAMRVHPVVALGQRRRLQQEDPARSRAGFGQGQDGRPRPKGPARARQGAGGIRGRPDAAEHHQAGEGAGKAQPVGSSGRRRRAQC